MGTTGSFSSDTERFLEWFKDQPGATFLDDIEILDLRHRNAGRGIVATADIPADTVLFTIPRDAIISVAKSDLPQRLPDVFKERSDWDQDGEEGVQDTSLDSWTSLILVLIYEYLRPDSKWRPYLDVLPQSFETLMFWTENELKELQASAVTTKIGKKEANDMFRSKILPVVSAHAKLFGNSAVSTDESEALRMCHRMGSVIMSYAFDLEAGDDDEDAEQDGWVEDRDDSTILGMVPMADILNADAEFNAHVNHGEEALTVRSLRKIKAGEEILNYYGPHPNSELLRRYGYVSLKHSRHDIVEISWELVATSLKSALHISDNTWDAAMASIDQDDLEESFVLERESGEPDSTGRLPGNANFEHLPEEYQEQVKMVLKAIKKADPSIVPDKRKRDELLQTVALASLEARLAQYDTPISTDEALLASSAVTGRLRMAIQVRLGEKKLLQEALEQVRQSTGEVDSANSHERPSKKSRQ